MSVLPGLCMLYSISLNAQGQEVVSYLGPEGTYTQEAAQFWFGDEGTFVPEETVNAAIERMCEGDADYAVIPQENTLGGAVVNYVDALIAAEDSYVVGEVVLPISQTLMGVPGTKMEDIQVVCSHVQGLTQSSKWREEHLPGAETKEMDSTAAAASYVAEQKDPSIAAVAAPGAAPLYGLEVLAENVQITDTNKTRFYVLASEPAQEEPLPRAVFVATCPGNQVDDVILAIREAGLELVTLHDRPEGSRLGQYHYVIETANEAGITREQIDAVCAQEGVRYAGSCDVMEKGAAAMDEDEMEKAAQLGVTEAVYLGVQNYGADEVNMDNKPSFLYRFEIDGQEQILKIDNGLKDPNGEYTYPIQNQLKEGYRYQICVQGDTVVYAAELPEKEIFSFTSPVEGTPGEKTLTNFLRTALSAAGTTLYIYGGGWDWQDVGSAVQTRCIGVSEDWVKFFEEQDADFTYKEKDGLEENADPASSYYPYGGYNEYYYAGLDCSGYLGWVLYNTLHTVDGEPGYVEGAVHMAKTFADMGLGQWSKEVVGEDGSYDLVPGDVVSIGGHVWISLGTCSDGSIVVLHSTPGYSRTGQPGGGVELSAIGDSQDCEAWKLADQYMAQYYPEWYERYTIKLCDAEAYFDFSSDDAGRFRWGAADGGEVTDPDGLQGMTPEEALKLLFA